MKLWLNDVALHELAAHLQILGTASAREPAEAPQRERRTVRVRLEFRADAYAANAALVASVRTALTTPTTPLRWEDDTGATYLERWVIVGDDDQPEADNAQGTYLQSLTFTFHYFVHTLTTNCLPATLTRLPSGPPQDLGAVLKWGETFDVDRFDALKDPRRKVIATVTCAGRFQGNTLQTLDECRTGLQATLDTLRAELVAGIAFRFQYGAFDRTVRLTRFTADVDQPHHTIEWNLSASFTRFPGDETDYAWLEYDLHTRTTLAEGIQTLGVQGRVAAATELQARATLAALRSGPSAVVPAGYLQLTDSTTPHVVQSADGMAFTELVFEWEYRDLTTLPLTLQKVGGPTARDLGVVSRFADRYSGQLFDENRPHRKRAGGTVSAAGAIFAGVTLTLAEQRASLTAQKALLDADFLAAKEVALTYGHPSTGVFPTQTVRLQEWDCVVDRFYQKLEWTLTASYTKYPNPDDFAVCEFKLGTREQKLEGTVTLALSGRVAAPTAAAARARLVRLRAAVIPAGYTRTGEEPQVGSASSESGGVGLGDGEVFIELTFSEEWQKTSGDLLSWTLRITDADDLKTGWRRVSYAGSVTAQGVTLATAWGAAQAQAVALAAGHEGLLISTSLTRNDKLFLTTGGVVFVTAEYSYEYQRKGTRTYLEVTAERTTDTFGQTTETVSGFVAAPSLAGALATYTNQVRTLPAYTGSLLLNERTPSATGPSFAREVGGAAADQFERYAFSFTVFVAKTAGQAAGDYAVQTSSNLQTLEQTSTVRGRVLAADRAAADTFLAALLGGLALGTPFGTRDRTELHQAGPKPTAGAVTVFLGLEFADTYVRKLTGRAGILECEVTEQLKYSGARLVEKPIPGSASLFQNTGVTPGQRVVSGRCKGTTESACLAWARQCRTLLLSGGDYEEAPTITTRFYFLPQTAGTARGADADVVVFETSFTFTEWLLELSF